MLDRLKALLTGRPGEAADPLRRERMVKAAGVTYAHVVCTPETWQKLVEFCTPGGAWSISQELALSELRGCDPVSREDGLVRVRLTGRELAEVLFWTGGKKGPLADDALATRIYDEAGRSVDQIDLEVRDGARLDDIVIDARLGSP